MCLTAAAVSRKSTILHDLGSGCLGSTWQLETSSLLPPCMSTDMRCASSAGGDLQPNTCLTIWAADCSGIWIAGTTQQHRLNAQAIAFTYTYLSKVPAGSSCWEHAPGATAGGAVVAARTSVSAAEGVVAGLAVGARRYRLAAEEAILQQLWHAGPLRLRPEAFRNEHLCTLQPGASHFSSRLNGRHGRHDLPACSKTSPKQSWVAGPAIAEAAACWR